MSLRKRRKFKAPRKVSKKKGEKEKKEDIVEEKSQYWSCNYTNFSRKKHKNWLTGFVVMSGQKFQLFDSYGKHQHSKTITSRKLESGSSIFSGGKEIEIDSEITKSEFDDGSLFEENSDDEENSDSEPKKIQKKKREASEPSKFSKASGKRWEKFQKKMNEKERRKKKREKKRKAKKSGEIYDSSSEEEEEEESNSPKNIVEISNSVRKPFLKVIPKSIKEQGRKTMIKEIKCIKQIPSRCYILDPTLKTYVDSFLVRVLRSHQIQAIQFMYDCFMGYKYPKNFGCLLGDEMGAGKTLSVIALLYTLLNRGKKKNPEFSMFKKIIIVTPSSLVSHWNSEISKWLGKIRVNPLIVSGKTYNKNPKDLIHDFGYGYYKIMIISYSLCVHYSESLKFLDEKGMIQCLVCDEAHKLKSENSRIYKTLMTLKTRRRLLITGTPIQNNLEEFFCVLNFMSPKIVGEKFEFSSYFSKPILKSKEKKASREEMKIGMGRCNELNGIVSKVMLRRKMKHLLKKELPQRNMYIVFLRLVDIQEKCYIRLLESNEILFDDNSNDDDGEGGTGRGISGNVLSLVQNMKKLLLHPTLVLSLIQQTSGRDEDLDDDESEGEDDKDDEEEIGKSKKVFPEIFPSNYNSYLLNIDYSCKLLKLSCLLDQFRKVQDKCIIVSNFTTMLDYVERLLNFKKLQFLRLDGSVPTRKREEIVSNFQNPMFNKNKYQVFLLSSRAGGVGLNLTAANRMVMLDPDWNPANDEQAAARIYRNGQTKAVHIYRFVVSGTIEEKIFQRQVMKKGLSDGIVDSEDGMMDFGNQQNKLKFTKEFLSDLFSYDSTKLNSTYFSEKLEENSENKNWKKDVLRIDKDGIGSCLDKNNNIIEFVKILDEEGDMVVQETAKEIIRIDSKKTGRKRKVEEVVEEEENKITKYLGKSKSKNEDELKLKLDLLQDDIDIINSEENQKIDLELRIIGDTEIEIEKDELDQLFDIQEPVKKKRKI